jgi:salicylate hydroxylase
LPLLPDSSATHFNKRCTSISTTASGSQCIHFADGTTHEADLVIGADGIKSISRNALVDPAKRPLQFTNTVAYRGLVPMDTLRQEGVTSAVDTRLCCFIGIDKVSGTHLHIIPMVSENISHSAAYYRVSH